MRRAPGSSFPVVLLFKHLQSSKHPPPPPSFPPSSFVQANGTLVLIMSFASIRLEGVLLFLQAVSVLMMFILTAVMLSLAQCSFGLSPAQV